MPFVHSRLSLCAVSLAFAVLLGPGSISAAQIVIAGPAGSGAFGRSVTTLPNGNIVVTDPGFDAPGPIPDVGAAYLYRPSGTLIGTLRGTITNDQIGSGGITVLSNGNYVVLSPNWDRNGFTGVVANVGAVTWVSGVSGFNGQVSASNSLVGSTANDFVGDGDIIALSNGNYVVHSPFWNSEAGAATFGAGVSGISGPVSVSNSLVGSSANDGVGRNGIIVLSNGNYVVSSSEWDNGATVDAGAATFGSGVSGISGAVSVSNSLVGSSANDLVGQNGVTALSNGNYVVASPSWDNGAAIDAGAATFGSGVSGISGLVSGSNSLVGNTVSDFIGGDVDSGITALSNGNYVVPSPNWDNGEIVNAGAATFGSGVGGINGVVSASNSLVGSSTSDQVGSSGVTALRNGNYVVISRRWSNGAALDAGAATFGSGVSGISGVVSTGNSLVGSSANNQVGFGGVTALSNGNYVVNSPGWDNGAVSDVGAATFVSGVSGISGVVSASNSLVGNAAGNQVGAGGVTALSNGNYVVSSRRWDNGTAVDAGAVTFGFGLSGISGVVSISNSLVGTSANDGVGGAVTALSNGNYVVRSPFWDSGAVTDVGAATFGSGVGGISGVVSISNSLSGSTVSNEVGRSITALSNGNYVVRSRFWNNGAGAATLGSGVSATIGVVSASNSLVGTIGGDGVGEFGVSALSNGNYVVHSPAWNNGALSDAGAITLGLADGSVTGQITDFHSVLGLVADAGVTQVFGYDALRNQLAVGQPASNRVVLHITQSPLIFANGFEN